MSAKVPVPFSSDPGLCVEWKPEHVARLDEALRDAFPDNAIPRDLIKEIAMDIGKDTVAYVEVQYPEAIRATSSTFKLSLRNHIYNEIMASIALNDPAAIRSRLKERQAFRRKWVAQYRKIRRGK